MPLSPTVVAPTSLYKRFMVERFDEREWIHVPTMFQSLFGRENSKTTFADDVLSVEIDIIKGDERMAPMVKRGAYSKTHLDHASMLLERFTPKAMDFPLIREETPIDAAQLFNRRPGEIVYAASNRQAKMRGLASDAHKEHVRKIIRRMEYLAAQSILTGAQPGFGSATEYDWNRDASLNFTGVDWSGAANDIIGNLVTSTNLIREKGHAVADLVIMGDDMFDGYINNTAVKNLADNRRIHQNEVMLAGQPEAKYASLIAAGAMYRGKCQLPNGYVLAIFTYNEGYTADNGTYTRYLPVDKAVVGTTGARCDRMFGPQEAMEMLSTHKAEFAELFGFAPTQGQMPPRVKNPAVVMGDMFKLDGYMNGDRTNVMIRTEAAPLFVTTHADVWSVITSA